MSIRTMLAIGIAATALVAPPLLAAPADASLRAQVEALGKQDNWGHPDLQGEHDGIRAYAQGHYRAAMKAFLRGARYADKLSQLCIGLMYLNGKGVPADAPRAWAWFAIAAQRDYPGFARTRDRTWATLTPAQRNRAKAIHARLLTTYGDRVAKARMRAALAHNASKLAGSRLGPGGEGIMCATPAGHRHNCDDIYAPWRWNPKQYFAVRDALYRGTVTVGQLQQRSAEQPPKR